MIKNGKLKMVDHEREAMCRWYLTFKHNASVDITVRKHSSKRSNQQNKYYWGVVIPILADYFGHDNAEDMHSDLKEKFNPIESKVKPGKIIGGTTTKMSTVEFYGADDSYVERVCRWAASEYQIYVPPPKKAEKGRA
jgi:hypothetical protein